MSAYVGIDLGTTNSALAAFDGETVTLVPNSHGENLTPSVVRIDARGTVSVGRRAVRFLETDPANTRAEFKRLMGTAEAVAFEACGRKLLPEELSAHVLGALLADARDRLGFAPVSAVISTPALFELPQNHATVRAGQLAGLAQVTLIQEPIASAIAAGWRAEAGGLWLVFDLGGGTLDVSLLETRESWLRVVDHWGDNFLGGKDFDDVLVDWALSRLRAQFDVPHLSRAEAGARRALTKLKAACEQAKIDLSRSERAALSVPELCLDAAGAPVDADLELTRTQFESLVEPLIERAVGVCGALLEKNKVGAADVGQVVLVGGPTLTPAVRQRVVALFGGRLAEGHDPMTLVARGAALYAATAGLDARPMRAQAATTEGLPVRIEHPAVTADVEPFVVGRFAAGEGIEVPAYVRIEREDGAFATADAPLGAEGGFALQVRLERQRQNRFRLRAFGADTRERAVRSPAFAIVHGLSVADPPLSRSVGVALSDDTVHVYFEKGTPLPARRTFVHQTVKAVAAGSGEEALRIPVVQGEYWRAHRNRLIGSLQIAGVLRDLPAGSRVEVTLHLDRSGQLRARADVPATTQAFEDVVHVLVPSASAETLERELEAAEGRVVGLRRRGFAAGEREALVRIEQAARLLVEARAGIEAARGGEADASQRIMRLLLDAGAALDSSEEGFEWPELEREADGIIHAQLSWVSARGTSSEQQLFEQALKAVAEARKARHAPELERQLKVMRSLGQAAFQRDPESPHYVLDWYAAHVSEATDLRRASELVERGKEARKRNDLEGVRGANRQLDDLFPGTARDRQLSFGSGVR